MIYTRLKIKKIYINNDNNNVSIFGEPELNKENLVIDNKFKTIKVNGEFLLLYGKDNIKENYAISVTISDIPNSSGYYRLLYPGILPNYKYMNNFDLFIKYICNSQECRYITELYKLNEKEKVENSIFRLIKAKKLTPFATCIEKALKELKTNVNINKNINSELKKVRKIYQKNLEIANFIDGLAEMGVLNEEEQLIILDAFKGKNLSEILVLLKENPFLLINETRLNLKTIDDIALRTGIPAYDDRRVTAISEYNLRVIGSTGKTWVNIDWFVSASISGNSDYNLYNLNTIEFEFESEKLKEQLIKLSKNFWIDNDKKRISSMMYYEMERELFEIISNLNRFENKVLLTEKSILKAISLCEKREGIFYSDEQKNSVIKSFNDNISIIAGPAGTGKSTIARAITESYKSYNILATALAGKATLRLMETAGVEGRTMHSYLARLSSQYFEADLIIIDEGSMLGLEIVLQFFRKIAPGTRVIILGDDSQLSPIGSGNVFSDLLSSKNIVKSHLKTVRRQALESNIIKFATMVRTQESIDIENNPFKDVKDDFKLILKNTDVGISRAITSEFKVLISKYDLNEIMIVTPYKIRGSVNTFDINNRMQNILLESNKLNTKNYKWLSLEEDINKKFVIYEGDRVINIQNNYTCKTPTGEKLPVMNGSIGTILKIEKRKVLIDFDGIGIVEFLSYDLKNILLGYAISVHKSQGSQAKAVIYALPEDIGRLGCCEQVYTAVTRAREIGIVIACIDSLNQCIITRELSSKQTLLKEFLDNDVKSFAEKYKPKKKEKELIEETNEVLDGQVTIEEMLPETEVFTEIEILEDIKEKKKLPKVECDKEKKIRERYDKNNIRRKLGRRNKNLLNEREQAKVDNIKIVQEMIAKGYKNKDIVEFTGLTKGTVSKYSKIDLEVYIELQVKKAKIKC